MIRASTTIKTYRTRAASSLTALSKVWSRYNSVDSIKPSFLTRSINSAYHNYSIPPGGYWPEYHPDRINDERIPSFENCWSYGAGSTFGDNSRDRNFVAGKSYGDQNSYWAYGNEFGGTCYGGNWNGDQYVGPHWRHYGEVCSNVSGRFEGYPNWENRYCPHSREFYYWGADVRHLSGLCGCDCAPHWVNGDARWNRTTLDIYGFDGHEWNVQPQINMDYYGNMVGGRPYCENLSGFRPIFSDDYTGDWNLSADFYPYRPDIHYFCTGGSEDLQEREQPVNPDWICGQYPQTWKNDGAHWNDPYLEKNNGFQKNLTEHGCTFNGRPVAGGPHYARNSSFRNGRVHSRPEVENNNNDDETPSTPKADAIFVPRENRRAFVLRGHSERTSPLKEKDTTGHNGGEVSDEARYNGHVSGENGVNNRHVPERADPVKSNTKTNGIHSNNPTVNGESHKSLVGRRSGDADIIYEHGAGVESLLPKLGSPDYYTQPHIQELAAKERAEPGFCSRVKDFVVGRRGYGSIKFLGETDVRGLDLEALVQLNNREVIVYMDDSQKPPVGQGLNKAAEVTLLNIKCIDKKTGRPFVEGPNVEKYRQTLKKKAADQGAEFVRYNPLGGEWVFRVFHFSTYRLCNEDGDVDCWNTDEDADC
ncbi:unnamed protein product [Rhodiola kirilowii]